MNKRLNIMLYSNFSGEQIILPVNPENIEIKNEKNFETYDIIGFGKVNIAGFVNPLSVRLSFMLPEDESGFALGSKVLFFKGNYIENNYTLNNTVSIFTKWAKEKYKIRTVIDDELNFEGVVKSFSNVVRENVKSRKCTLEILEYKNPTQKAQTVSGLYQRLSEVALPKTLLMKKGDTIYSIAHKYGLDFKKLAETNGIKDVNADLAGVSISIIGGLK